MSDNIKNRDGNLVTVDFTKKSAPQINLQGKEANPLSAVAVATALTPVLIAGAAVPFLAGDKKDNDTSDKSPTPHEQKLDELPEHMRLPPSEIIKKFSEKQGDGHVSRIEKEEDSGKQR